MYSIFMLCEYKISINTVLKLYENNISIIDILNDNTCLNLVLGDSFKKEEILSVLSYIVYNKKKYSIFDLVAYDLSKNIVDMLYSKKIDIFDINPTIKEKHHIGEVTYSKIEEAYNLFKKTNNIRDEMTSELLYTFIFNKFKYDTFNFSVLLEDLKSENKDIEQINSLINELILNEKLVKNDELYNLVRPKDAEYKSIFLFCDYGAAYNTVLKLHESNITFTNILEDPECINKVLGLNSIRAEEIKSRINDINNSNKTYSVYDLMNFGLSKSIVALLVKNNILFNDINEDLMKKDFISSSTFNKIIRCYNDFVMKNNIKRKLDASILTTIMKNTYKHEIVSINDIIATVENNNYDSVNINAFLEKLLKEKIVQKGEEGLFLSRPKLRDELLKISTKNNHYDIVMKKLSGQTLESIGTEYNVTRERIRQIIQKEFKKVHETEEENKFKELFELYNFDCELFCELYNADQTIYYYLKENYKSGEQEPSDLIENSSLSSAQLETLKKKYNLVNYKGENFVVKKNSLLLAILKYHNGFIEYTEMINEYNNIINDNNLELEKLSEEDYRNIDSILSRSTYVLCDAGRYYRYYNVDELDEIDIKELQNMLEVEAGDYSSEFFFNNNQLLMKKIDIRNEYELHNLLRKIIGNYNGKIIFSRMPDIFIACDDKYIFVENLIQELSPVSVDEFSDFVYQNYGHKNNTFKALLLNQFSKYINNGVLISECPEFNQEQLELLRTRLTDDIYSIITIKELLTELFDVNDFKLLNNMNMSKLGYKLRGNYMMKSNITNLEGYLRNIILSSDYYEINPEMKKIGSTFSSYLYKFIYNLDLFKISDEKYITIKKLNEMGISKEDISMFIEEINKVIADKEYFNLHTLDEDNYLTKLKKYEFPDCFYETIISTIPNVRTFRLKNNSLFIKTEEQATREKFINNFIEKNKTYLNEIKNEIYNKYNIDLPVYYIREFINKKKCYFDSSIDCVYLNKDLYEEDINDFDILQFID